MALTRVKGATFTASENFLYTNVKDFGAVGNGVADDTAAIQAAIDSLSTTGGTVFFSPGTYALNTGTGINAIALRDGIHLRGSGIQATTLILQNNADVHMILSLNRSDIGISHMTLDGNSANQAAAVNNIRLIGSNRVFLNNLRISNARNDGIFLETGTFTDIFIEDIMMNNIGNDGIDIINDNDNNARFSINNVHVQSFGAVVANAAGLDIRGQCNINNITIEGVSGNESGIRLNAGEAASGNGIGAHQSSLNNFRIIASAADTTRGVAAFGRDLAISNGYVMGCQIGLLSSDQRNKISNVTFNACVPLGMRVDALAIPGGTLFDTLLTNCIFDSCTDEGLEIQGSRTIVDGCAFLNNTNRGVDVQATANDTLLMNSNFSGNPVAVLDNGVNTHARNNNGWLTEVYLAGVAQLWDAIGLKTELIAHGLAVTPTLQQCRIAKVKVTGNNDGAFDWTMVSAVDATNVTAESIVGTANTLAAATFNHLVYINARP